MSFAKLLGRLKLSQHEAEVIFDRNEPMGTPTDIVLPRRRWFRRKSHGTADARSLQHTVVR